jgi:peptidoglycan/LPS O-acetylase OafA/YrhL
MTMSGRNIPLDVLRAVACVLVCGAHITTVPPASLELARWWREKGTSGVPLFFVLSGFLISGLLLDEFKRRGDIKVGRFLVRRGLKIYPAYLAFLGYLVAMPVFKAVRAGGDWMGELSTRTLWLIPNLLSIQNYVYDREYTPMHTWSLAVEEWFYLIVPFVLLWLLRRNLLKWLLPMYLASHVIVYVERYYLGQHYTWTHVAFTYLLGGVLLRCTWHEYPEFQAWCSRFAWPLLLAGIVLFLFENHARFPIMELGCLLIVAGSVHLNRDYFPRQLHFLRFVPLGLAMAGAYSYSIYLWHVTSMRWADKISIPFILGPLGWYPAMLFSLCVGFAVGILFSKLIEYPVLHLRDRLFPASSAVSKTPKKVDTQEMVAS